MLYISNLTSSTKAQYEVRAFTRDSYRAYLQKAIDGGLVNQAGTYVVCCPVDGYLNLNAFEVVLDPPPIQPKLVIV